MRKIALAGITLIFISLILAVRFKMQGHKITPQPIEVYFIFFIAGGGSFMVSSVTIYAIINNYNSIIKKIQKP